MIPTIVEFVTESAFLGLSISPGQEALLRAIYGLPLAGDHLELYRRCTGRENAPAGPFGEATVLAGARAGKDSRIAAPIVCYEALFGGHEKHLSKGERGVIPLVAQDQKATRVAFGYIKGYLMGSAVVSSMLDGEPLASEAPLINGINVSCFPSTLRSLRGWSIPAAVLDELAYFQMEGAADSDVEIQASVRRGMISFLSPRLVKISTPYMRRGVLYDDFKRAFGVDDPDLLVWKAPSALMNPLLSDEAFERQRRLDPERFAREYEAEFDSDVDAFLPGAAIEQAIVPHRIDLPPLPGATYVAAVDPSGGRAGGDAFTLAIGHTERRGEDERAVVDLIRGWSGRHGVDLEGVVSQIAEIVKGYGLGSVSGDAYAANWVRERFQAHGVRYEPAEVDRSRAYLETEPLFMQGRVDLPDHAIAAREFKMLERRPRPGGKVLVDHPRGGHDDYANVCALVIQRLKVGSGASFAGETIEPPAEFQEALRCDYSGQTRSRSWGRHSRPQIEEENSDGE